MSDIVPLYYLKLNTTDYLKKWGSSMVIQKIFVDGIIFLDFEIRCIDTVNVSASKYMFKILIFRTRILGDCPLNV